MRAASRGGRYSLRGDILRRDTCAPAMAAGAATFTARYARTGREVVFDGDRDEARGGGGGDDVEEEDEEDGVSASRHGRQGAAR